MKKEVLRLQMLSGIISESVYKEKLEEGAFDNPNVSESLNEGILTTLDRFGQFKADKRMSMAENSDKQKIKISKKELAKIISEEIVRFKKKTLLENRLREIDEELKNL